MPGSLADIFALPRRAVRNISVATRLSLVILVVALVSLVITSVVGIQRGSQLAGSVLEDRIESVGAARADEVERFADSLRRATVAQAISPSTAQAIDSFDDAFGDLLSQQPSNADTVAVTSYYAEVIAPDLSEARGRPVNPTGLIPRRSAAITLQADYVVDTNDGREPALERTGSNPWSDLHLERHESFDEFVIQTGIDDIYLIEPDANTIVYSYAKNIDFATSLLTGPHSGSALALLIQSFGSDPAPGTTAIRDFNPYAPAGDEPSLFVAGPVHDGDVLAGFVAIRIGPERLTSITTNDESWSASGDTGETFVVAGDDLMRSDARGFIEDRGAYLTTVAETGNATEDQVRSMRAVGTTVLYQPVDDAQVEAALDGEPELTETTNHLGVSVLQARRALDIDGLDWAMVSEIETQEIQEPIVDFAHTLLIAIALLLVTITFIATRWSNRLLHTLRVVSLRLRMIRDDDIAHDPGSAALPDGAPREFVDLAADIDTMLQTLTKRNAEAADRVAERRQLLRRILPAQAALRAEAGERDVVDQVAHATVAVIVMNGLGSLMRSDAGEGARALLDQFVEEADALARRRGLERIRLTGDTYFASCGTVRPHMDHAARAVSFVLDVRDLVRDLVHEFGDGETQISITAGIDSGPVTVGLTGGSDLVYDAWGPTVQRAADLARVGRVGTIYLTRAVQAQLPPTFDIEPAEGGTDVGAATVSGRSHDGEPAR